ncbi:hypothetical protein [Longispora albida]|uniref:hypothetical protein n=1 Tax=Longispora albida TaxID=203523 RepID=UPI000477E55F|nr:hypothetical protein [Longispora albida]
MMKTRQWAVEIILKEFPWAKHLHPAELACFADEHWMAHSWEKKEIESHWSYIVTARLRDRRDGRNFQLVNLNDGYLQEQRLRRKMKRHYQWDGFPYEQPFITDNDRWREFRSDLEKLAGILYARWRHDRKLLGELEQFHFVAEILNALGWEYAPEPARRHANLLFGDEFRRDWTYEMMALHDESLDLELCPRCYKRRDPDAPHRVYLAHYPSFRVYKIGVTTQSSDRRLQTHRSAGASIVDALPAASFTAALSVEKMILEKMKPWRRSVPYISGGSECWSDSARYVGLRNLAKVD